MSKYILSGFIIIFLLLTKTFAVFAQQAPNNPIDNAPPEISSDAFSCPVSGGSVITHSYQVDPQGGHCGQSYSTRYACNCGSQGRRAKAIDVATNGGDVFLPQIGGKDVNWRLNLNYTVSASDGGGNGYVFEAEVNGTKWFMDFVHLSGAPVERGQTYPSGTNLGKISEDHVHFTIGKNLANSPVAGTETDCDPNWLPSDFACDANAPVPTSTGTRPAIASSQGTKSSNRLCVKVGNPTTEKPAACTAPVISTTTGQQSEEAPYVDPAGLKQAIVNELQVDMQGNWNEQALRWFYEKMYRVKQTNPKFAELIIGEKIVLCDCYPNQLAGYVQMSQGYSDGEKFMGTLIHELGHVIYHNRSAGMSLVTDHAGLFQGAAGPATTYGQGDITENYPDMLSYCLTKRSVGSLLSQERWEIYYKPLAERITGGPCL